MGYDVQGDPDAIEAYIKNLRHVQSKLYEFTGLLKQQQDPDGWDDENRVRYDAIISEIIRDIQAILADFDPPIMELERMLIPLRDMGRVM